MSVPARPALLPWLGFATLVRREVRRSLKEWPETVAAPVLTAVLYLTVFAVALGPERDGPQGDALMQRIAPGLVVFTVMMRAAESTVFSLVFDRMEGMIADVLMPPLSALELTAAYAIAGTVAGLVTGLPALATAALLVDLPVASPGLVLAIAAASGLMMAFTGMLVGLWARRWDHVAAVFGFVLVPLSFLSGLFAPVEALPAPLDAIARANPLFYAIDGMRAGFLGSGVVDPRQSLAVLLATGAALAAIAYALIARGWRLKG